MMYKTFVLEKEEHVFVPNEPVVNKKRGYRYCCCVHTCPVFINYPVDKWGRKIIPDNAVCPYVMNKKGELACMQR